MPCSNDFMTSDIAGGLAAFLMPCVLFYTHFTCLVTLRTGYSEANFQGCAEMPQVLGESHI